MMFIFLLKILKINERIYQSQGQKNLNLLITATPTLTYHSVFTSARISRLDPFITVMITVNFNRVFKKLKSCACLQ